MIGHYMAYWIPLIGAGLCFGLLLVNVRRELDSSEEFEPDDESAPCIHCGEYGGLHTEGCSYEVTA